MPFYSKLDLKDFRERCEQRIYEVEQAITATEVKEKTQYGHGYIAAMLNAEALDTRVLRTAGGVIK
ncbi:hypothetical protein [Pseudomonas sp. ZS1P83]